MELNQVGDDQQAKYCFGVGNLGTICHDKVPSLSTLPNVRTSTWEIPHRIDEDSNLKIDKTFSEQSIYAKQRLKNVTEEIKSRLTLTHVLKNDIKEQKFQTEKIQENKNSNEVKHDGSKHQLTKRKCQANNHKTTVDTKNKSLKRKEMKQIWANNVCHQKCVDGMEMKRVRIDISKNTKT